MTRERRPGSRPAEKRCAGCGQPLTTDWQLREGVCSRLACRGPYLQRQRAEQEHRARVDRDALVAQARAAVARRPGHALPELTAPGAAVLMVVPHFAGRPAPQPADRIRRFETNLRAALDEALRELRRAAVHGETCARRHDDAPRRAVVNACTTCRGACCRQGGEHAFLDPEFLAGRLLREPESTSQVLLDDYLARLPVESFDESCVYHTPAGCALPRAIRSPTCNEFLCTGILDRAEELEADPHRPALAVTFDRDRFRRAGWTDRAGQRIEFDLTGG